VPDTFFGALLLGAWMLGGFAGMQVLATESVPAETVRLLAGDVPYVANASAGQTLDLYGPKEAVGRDQPQAPRSVAVFVHGGGWRHGDKANVGEKPQAFVQRGHLFASVNYRLEKPVTPREQAADVASAVSWLREHTGEFGGDPRKIFLVGHSAGAHLAALVATDDRLLRQRGLEPEALSGVVLLDGAGYDVPRQMAEARLPRLRQLYRDAFGDDPETLRDSSPVTHVRSGKRYPPFLIFHVGMRGDSRTQAGLLAGKLRAAGGRVQVVHEPKKNHMTLNRELGLPGDAPTQRVLDFMEGRWAVE